MQESTISQDSGMANPTAHRGFTLLELLVVLGITVLLVAVIPPFLPDAIDAMQVRTAVRDLAAGLRQARGKAITSRSPATVTLDVEKRVVNAAGRPRTFSLPPEATITLTTASSEKISDTAGAIRFYPDGSSTGGRIDIAYRKAGYVIDVSWPTGAVKVTP